mmetsp:Transcript_96497/g.191197  ORF Transcript_96497/g.191197 Transcript_96497/m.191197 type:complete len:537 (+) Transcript_96497:166-1776(+)
MEKKLTRTGTSGYGRPDGLERSCSLVRTLSATSNVHRDDLTSGITYGATIHFTCHSVKPNVLKPWKVFDPEKSTGTGFYVGNKMVITNHHVIANSTSIRLERHGQPGNFQGRVLCESQLSDLALLTVDDDSFWDELPNIEFQEEVPSLDDTVVAVGYPLGASSVTVTRGVVSNVALEDLTVMDINPRQLQVQIDAAINPGNSGGPVFNVDTGEVVGVAFSGRDEGEGQGFIIPVPVVKLFIDSFHRNQVGNPGPLPELGITVQSLENPSLRKSCFRGTLPEHRHGCLITSVAKYGCADGNLQVGDVMLKIDSVNVSQKGEVVFRGQEWLPWEYLITKKPPGESVTVTVLRQGVGAEQSLQEVECTIVLAPSPKLAPRILGVDYFPSYVIYGGIVFLPVGRPVGRAQVNVNGNFADVITEVVDRAVDEGELTEPDQQLCLVTSVLPHSINVSYDWSWGKIASKINGIDVKNMRHLAKLCSEVQEGEVTIDFKVQGDTRQHVVFDATEVKECNDEILAANKINHWCSPELLEARTTRW